MVFLGGLGEGVQLKFHYLARSNESLHDGHYFESLMDCCHYFEGLMDCCNYFEGLMDCCHYLKGLLHCCLIVDG